MADNLSAQRISSTQQLLQDPQFRALSKRKNTISLVLTLATLAVYFGFIFLLAFSQETLAVPVGSTTLGIPLGIGIIVLSWIFTGIYVRWANRNYEAMVADIKARFGEHNGA